MSTINERVEVEEGPAIAPQISFNKHGHRVYTPSRGSEYKATHGHSKRWRNKVRAWTIQGTSLNDAEATVRIATKTRKQAEHKAAVDKHHKALAGRRSGPRNKFVTAPTGKEKR